MDQLSTHLNFSMQSYDPTILNVTNVTVGVGRGQKIAKMLSTQFMNDFIFILLCRIYSYNVCTYIQYPCCMRNNVHIFLHNGAKPFMKQQYFNFQNLDFFRIGFKMFFQRCTYILYRRYLLKLFARKSMSSLMIE